jgi:ATP-dependent helicase/nuclease subunit A
MTKVENVMILASAGSGKTYELTNRFVRLLALGAKPDRIVALTFTRKAAGEFFGEILKKLARAASDGTYATRLAAEIDCINQGQKEFLRMLRGVVDAMPRLQLGTLDGFFARIAQNFPLEFGLSGQFEIMEEHATRIERARVLKKMFQTAGSLLDEQREFIEAFKRATFGAEEKRLGNQLDEFLDAHHEVFLKVPLGDYWGNVDRIWPEGLQWTPRRGTTKAALTALRDWIGAANLADKQAGRWREFILAWSEWTPGVVPERPLAYVLEKVLERWDDIANGNAVLEFDRKKQVLSSEACQALAELTRFVVSSEISRRVEVTRGIHAVLASYEANYQNAVRRSGKLTFGDVQRLLVPSKSGVSLSSHVSDNHRLYIDFRLDTEIDHWLLDEFQDTSFDQWLVLKNLVDEAIQDPTGTRSLFYVGDVKQAIFAWREGDPRLFREIFDHYNSVRTDTIREKQLFVSWRSGPAVIEAVNQVFGDAVALTELFPGSASAQWTREWRNHESAHPEMQGHVALLHGDDEETRFALALSVLQEVEPIERGLTCGVLVQSNAMAARLADYLRREGGLPAVADSDLRVCIDNPVGVALLSLLKAAAHPGDSLASEHLRMTPFGDILREQSCSAPDVLTQRVLQQIHNKGFEGTVSWWLARLHDKLPDLDEFSQIRARQITEAAGRFDGSQSRNVAEFLEFMESYALREPEMAGVVRVMTIHKSKGLGFDLVLLPDLEGVRIDCRREGLAVQKSADRVVEWVLDLPGKIFHAHDPVLSTHVASAESEACYEALSLLYVAMTRAKRAMYIVTKPAGSSSSRNYPKLLSETLGESTANIALGSVMLPGAFSAGDSQWYLPARPSPVARERTAIPIVDVAHQGAQTELGVNRPSDFGHQRVEADRLFSFAVSHATEFGNEVHRLLSEVEWANPDWVIQKEDEWRRRGEIREVVANAVGTLHSEALSDVWQHRVSTEIWRERAFEIIVDQRWISGVFDRVMVERGPTGQAVRATIYDFKTDDVRSSAERRSKVERYSHQLNLYRGVASVLTGLSPELVGAEVIFTRTPSRAVVPYPAEVG